MQDSSSTRPCGDHQEAAARAGIDLARKALAAAAVPLTPLPEPAVLLQEVFTADREKFWELVDHIDELRVVNGGQPLRVSHVGHAPIVREGATGRFPLLPLRKALGWPSTVEVARLVGAHPRQVYRWQEYGLSEEQADGAACRAGLHPALVWPEWMEVER